MTLRKILFLFCLMTSFVCLSGGYGMAGQWIGAGAVLAPVIAWLFSQRYPATWPAHACLVFLVCLAAVGLLEGAPALLMIPGATAALASWDLQHFDRSMKGSSPVGTTLRFEKNHIQSLAIALGLGLLLAVTAGMVALQIPFIFLILLIVIDLLSLDRAFRYLKTGAHIA